jgi:hypothetical protein
MGKPWDDKTDNREADNANSQVRRYPYQIPTQFLGREPPALWSELAVLTTQHKRTCTLDFFTSKRSDRRN